MGKSMVSTQSHNHTMNGKNPVKFLAGGILGQVDGVIRIRRVGTLGKQERARQGAHDDGDDPPKDRLSEHHTVDAARAFKESHASGSTHLSSAMRARSKHNTPVGGFIRENTLR